MENELLRRQAPHALRRQPEDRQLKLF